MRAGVPLFLCWLCLFPRSSVAQAAPAADALCRAARSAYDDGEFERSLALLSRARAQAGTDSVVIGRIELLAGLNRFVIGDARAAEQHFVRALRAQPTLRLDPAIHKPEVVRIFVRAKASLRGQLEVLCARRAATVEIDGRPAGSPPVRVSLPIGSHQVSVTRGDGRGETRPVVIQADRLVRVTFALPQPRPGLLEVRSSPPGATVDVQGSRVGRTPTRLTLRPSTYAVTLSKGGYLPHQRQVVVEPAKRVLVEARLRRAPRSGRRVWTWVAAGGAALAAGTAVALWASAKGDFDEYNVTDDRQRFFELERRIDDKEIGIGVSVGLAVAAAATAVVLYLLEK